MPRAASRSTGVRCSDTRSGQPRITALSRALMAAAETMRNGWGKQSGWGRETRRHGDKAMGGEETLGGGPSA